MAFSFAALPDAYLDSLGDLSSYQLDEAEEEAHRLQGPRREEMLARIEVANFDREAASERTEAALRRWPGDAGLLEFAGELAWAVDRPDDAELFWRRGLQAGPSFWSPSLRCRLAQLHLERDEVEDAIALLDAITHFGHSTLRDIGTALMVECRLRRRNRRTTSGGTYLVTMEVGQDTTQDVIVAANDHQHALSMLLEEFPTWIHAIQRAATRLLNPHVNLRAGIHAFSS